MALPPSSITPRRQHKIGCYVSCWLLKTRTCTGWLHRLQPTTGARQVYGHTDTILCVCVCNGIIFVFLFYMSHHFICSELIPKFSATPLFPPVLHQRLFYPIYIPTSPPLSSLSPYSVTSYCTYCPLASQISSLRLSSLWDP